MGKTKEELEATLKALPNASLRTKNRIKENNPFLIIDVGVFQGGGELQGREAMLLSSTKTDWLGWLPSSEFIFED